jgi:hypothetical protein
MNESLYKLVFFLLFAERQDENMMFGGHSINEVVDALADIMKVPPDKLRELA